MPNAELPERASLEFLKKLAKDRLHEMRRTDPRAQLAAALLSVARDYGFPSWRALKAEIDRRETTLHDVFFEACASGDTETLRQIVTQDPALVHLTQAERFGWTGLHAAAAHGHLDAVRLLLRYGADPNARDQGDNAYPLHFAAGKGYLEIVRALLDAGADVHGFGDLHRGDIIGWATGWGSEQEFDPQLVALLIERGARHNIFSAIATGDLELIRRVVEENPDALDRRMSRFEQGMTPLHYAISRKRYDILDVLLELGADVAAPDINGHTPLSTAMLRGNSDAIHRLIAAGAQPPEPTDPSNFKPAMANLAMSVHKSVPMIQVPDVAAALEWYTSIGFKEIARFGEDGVVNFGMVSYGKAELMLNIHGKAGSQPVSLWFYTDRVDELYEVLKSRQVEAAQARLAGRPIDHQGIDFVEDIYNTFYNAREFGIRDLNGYVLYFIQPLDE